MLFHVHASLFILVGHGTDFTSGHLLNFAGQTEKTHLLNLNDLAKSPKSIKEKLGGGKSNIFGS